MNDFEAAAYDHLSTLGVLGSPLEAIRVYYHVLPQNPTLPAMVYDSEGTRGITHDGASGLGLRSLWVTVFDVDIEQATEIAREVSRQLAGVNALWTDVRVQCHEVLTFRPLTEPMDIPGGFEKIHQIPLRAEMWISEVT
jgi:hypothetical protein